MHITMQSSVHAEQEQSQKFLIAPCICTMSVCAGSKFWLYVCVSVWTPLTNIIISLIGVCEQKQEGFDRAQRFPAAACCREKTVSCFLLVDSVAVGHSVVVNSTKPGHDWKEKASVATAICGSSEFT